MEPPWPVLAVVVNTEFSHHNMNHTAETASKTIVMEAVLALSKFGILVSQQNYTEASLKVLHNVFN
jgi:hypothetical protein